MLWPEKMFNYENQIYNLYYFRKSRMLIYPSIYYLKYKSKGMWTQVTKVTRVFRDKFPKDAQYDTVISVIRQYNLNPDASHCLVDMQNRIVDRHDFSIVSYVHNNRKYVGATRIYLGINRYWYKYIKYLNN